MLYDDDSQPQTLRDALLELTVDDLKPLAALVCKSIVTRKGDLVELLTTALGSLESVQEWYNALNDRGQAAVQEATHDPEGALDLFMFKAKYGSTPNFGGSGRRYGRDQEKPTALRLFFPHEDFLPRDLQTILRGFVPEPSPLTVQTHDDVPPTVRLDDDLDVDLRIRETSRSALHDVKAILRLIDLGEVRVSEKTRRPSLATMKVIAKVLAEGEFYSEEDQSEYKDDPDSDLRIQAFAWPMLLQAAGLAETAGARLQLTTAGRKAMAKPPHELIRQIWEKWQKTTLLDEFSRINAIKGQQSKGRVMTAVAPRRKAVVEVLRKCPTQKWITTDELFRVLKALARDFEVTHDEWRLYIGESGYGNLGNGGDTWNLLQGRYSLAFLFEYAATLGLLDVAYILPEGVRNDYGDYWGADFSCLSRYDGAMYFRINALGAWCLGLAKGYEPEVAPPEPLLRVLPNRDVVATERAISSADALFLERYAERKSEAVWHLEAGKILDAVGKGMTVKELRSFLETRNHGPLPQTVKVFLDDMANKLDQLEDLGSARLISCKDANVAQLLVHDRRLSKICQLAGERQIVFRAADETTIRRVLKELGYVLPPPR